ncbi:MAG TPA: acyl-CoA dehydrogenase family protein [Solirubrobacteraceae bacterium]|nr:acyl-CoA dehydrogenase family protein [Solirubrobacteraceae bacterium]
MTSTESDLLEPARQPLADAGTAFDLRPTDEQRMLVDTVREFALRACRPAALAADATCRTPPELLGTAAEIGLGALGVPEALGGFLDHRSTVTGVLAAEALAEGDMGIALACLSSGAVATALGLWGDPTQQATHLAAFADAAPPVAALAVAEPQVLFDPFALRTRARRVAGGDLLLHGSKALVPRGVDADLLVVAAMLDETPSLFLVEPAGARGLTVAAEPAMGVRAAATARLEFEDMPLPAGALLAQGDPQVYREMVALARIGWSALALGTAQAVLAYVSTYVNERTAFGEPISNRQSVAFAVADIAIELESLRLSTYRAARLAETGGDFIRAASLTRALAARHAMAIGSAGVQLLGGHGYTKEHPVERWYRDLRAAGMLEGGLIL